MSFLSRSFSSARPVAVALPFLLVLPACGTIQRGGSEDVRIDVTPATATITTDFGETCQGSCTLSVPRAQGFIVTAAAPGYYPESVRVQSVISLAGARSVAANAAGPVVVGVGVDLYTGAVYDHTPNPVVIRLEPRPVPATPGASGAARVLPRLAPG